MVAKMLRLTKSILILLGCRLKKMADYSTKHHPDIFHEAHHPTHALGSPSMRAPVFIFFHQTLLLFEK
jgi:hypothetical protein